MRAVLKFPLLCGWWCSFVLGFGALAEAADISLQALDLTKVRTGWGQVRAGRAVGGAPLKIAGRAFSSGVGLHAAGAMSVALDGKATAFKAWVGVDDEVGGQMGSVEFMVEADGKPVWSSGVMKTGQPAREVAVPLAGVKMLNLIVTDAGDGISFDHADWADAVITGGGGAKAVPVQTGKRFSHPERVRYDGHCVQLEGRDTFIYCAAFHYFRTPRELWRDRFRKIREAGFNTVETYTPWNWHERKMPAGLEDFSKVDLTELADWLKMAHEEFGFYTMVRPGPFICAEWAGGGYPRWLAKFGPGAGDLWLRGSDDAHVAWCRHWYQAVGKLIASEQLIRKPAGAKGIIMVQIENEYNHHGTPGKAKLLRALYDTLLGAGVEIPVFTCLTSECRGSSDPKLSQVFDCDNYYVGLTESPGCAHRMMDLRKRQPDAPGFVTELQGGWFSTIGGGLSEDHYSDARHFNAIHWMSMLGGATGLTPYVFTGGTHFGCWGSRGQTTTYDYNAAIREWGGRNEKYLVARGVGEFLRDHGITLARAEGGPCALPGAPATLFGGVRVARDGTRFVFLLNNHASEAATGRVRVEPGEIAKPTAPIYNIDQYGRKHLIETKDGGADAPVKLPPFEVDYDLGPLGAKVLVVPPGKSPAEGVWYPKPQPPIDRPQTLPPAVRIASCLRQQETGDARWAPLPAGASLPELGVDDQRYTMYRAKLTLTADEAARLGKLLVNSFSRDIISVRVNGALPRRIHPSDAYAASAHRNTGTSHQRIGPGDFDNRFDLAGRLRAGENEFLFLYENIGHEHGYVPMEELSGIRLAGLGDTEQAIAKPLALEVATDLGGIAHGWHQPGFDASAWQRVALDTAGVIPHKGKGAQPQAEPDALLTWVRLEFELPAADPKVFMPWLLRLSASGNGDMYLNGHNLGRHYEAGPQREFYLPECWLNFGPGRKNVLVLALRQTIHGAVVRAAEVAPYQDAAEMVGTP